MPIKAENRKLYPPNWRTISLSVRVRADMKCEFCGIRNYSVGYRDRNGIFFRLCGSDPCDAAGEGLRYDTKHHGESAYHSRRKAKAIDMFDSASARTIEVKE